MKRKIIPAVLLAGVFLILTGCIKIEPRNKDNAPAAITVSPQEKALVPDSKTDRELHLMIMDRIKQGTIRWEDISRYPAPEQSWREDRFRLLRPKYRIQTTDFRLKKIIPLPRGHRRFVYSFLPLRVAYDGKSAWNTLAEFETDEENEVADIHLSSERIPLTQPMLLRLSASDCNAISTTVLKTLFRELLPENVRPAERYRFCFPVNGADEKFHDHLRPRARIPELDPNEEYPDFPIPFEKGRYRSCAKGVFYYYAGIVLPVTDKEVWVFDTAIRYDGGELRGLVYKLKKGLIFWEVVTNASFDAPSRAVREKEDL